MTRHSEHDVSVSLTNGTGQLVSPSSTRCRVNLSEAQFPYGEVEVVTPLPADAAVLEITNPRRGDVRLMVDLRESVGDPVRVSEITAEHAGSMASLTAMFTGDTAPVTARYFTAWNSDEQHGSALRGNFLVTSREIDHVGRTVTYRAYTDEAALTAYRLLARTAETSGSLSVRDTVNYALAKIGAALVPSSVDAVIAEADAIVWDPGVSGWEYVRNVAEAAGLVVRCDQRRRWTLTRRDDVLPDVVVLDRHVSARERIELDADLYADGVIVRYEWRDAAGDTKVRYDTASQTSTPAKTVLIERDVPYPGPGTAKYWLKRLAARGRVFDLSQVSDYAIRPGMQFTTILPATPAQVGHVESVEWALPDRTMTITTTGAADAVPGAIDLYPDGLMIDDLIGTIHDQNPGSET